MRPLEVVTQIAREIQRPGGMEEILAIIIDGTARALGAGQASLRVLDPTGTRLVAACRSGEPLHIDPDLEYSVGEGLMGWIVENVRPLRTGAAEKDPRFVERADRKNRIGSFLGAPVVSGRICLGVIGAVHPREDYFTPEHEEILLLIATVCAPVVEEHRFSHISAVDPLTSAMSRRGIDVALPDSRLSGSTMPVSVVMVDLDRLSRVNDRWGDVVGDQILREVARTLAAILGAGDALVRYGGEEFLMILPGVDREAAGRVAEEARRAIQSMCVGFQGVEIRVTASFGVAERKHGESRADLLMRADGAVLAAKAAGRNQVALAL